MKGLFIFPVLLILLFGTHAVADLAKGIDAFEKEDYAIAFKELKPLAEQGDAEAQNYLGFMYSNGQGVTQDYRAAVKWYKLAAEQGEAHAQGNLGTMYYYGRGVTQDYTRALMWWNIVVSLGDKGAAKNRDIVAREMTYTQIEKAQDLASECVAKDYKDC